MTDYNLSSQFLKILSNVLHLISSYYRVTYEKGYMQQTQVTLLSTADCIVSHILEAPGEAPYIRHNIFNPSTFSTHAIFVLTGVTPSL